jgi:hypothetical protein
MLFNAMRTCAFCPSTKLTREHIWGDWINGIVPQVTYTTQRKTSLVDFAEPWKSIGIQQIGKVVCQNCNNGWMSDLEANHAKPAMADMIRYGGAVSLLPKGIASISAWALKMSVIANFVGKLKNEPYFTNSERYEFARTMRVPSGVQMWLFSLSTPGRVIGKFNSHLGRFPAKTQYGFELYIATFAIGYFGIQVVASRWINPHLVTFLGPFPGLREHDKWNGISVPLFPSDGSPVLWPPRFHLNGDTVEEFINRWKNMDVPAWMV